MKDMTAVRQPGVKSKDRPPANSSSSDDEPANLLRCTAPETQINTVSSTSTTPPLSRDSVPAPKGPASSPNAIDIIAGYFADSLADLRTLIAEAPSPLANILERITNNVIAVERLNALNNAQFLSQLGNLQAYVASLQRDGAAFRKELTTAQGMITQFTNQIKETMPDLATQFPALQQQVYELAQQTQANHAAMSHAAAQADELHADLKAQTKSYMEILVGRPPASPPAHAPAASLPMTIEHRKWFMVKGCKAELHVLEGKTGAPLMAAMERLLMSRLAPVGHVSVVEVLPMRPPRGSQPDASRRYMVHVASLASADALVHARHKLKGVPLAILDVLSPEERLVHQQLWPTFIAARALGLHAQFQRARLFVTKPRASGGLLKLEIKT